MKDIAPLFIHPDWPAPKRVKTRVTTRYGGVSQPPWDSLNLALHVSDNPEAVKQNRQIIRYHLPAEPCWLNQQHTSDSVLLTAEYTRTLTADAAFSNRPNQICTVMTADCLPLLVCSHDGKWVAAIHAGWKGLASAIIQKTIEKLLIYSRYQAEDYMVWMGPAISQSAFEVGAEVRQIFLAQSAQHDPAFIRADRDGKYLADIYQLAENILQQCGINAIYQDDFCTYRDSDRFFSYRRDGTTGRMASMIWISD